MEGDAKREQIVRLLETLADVLDIKGAWQAYPEGEDMRGFDYVFSSKDGEAVAAMEIFLETSPLDVLTRTTYQSGLVFLAMTEPQRDILEQLTVAADFAVQDNMLNVATAALGIEGWQEDYEGDYYLDIPRSGRAYDAAVKLAREKTSQSSGTVLPEDIMFGTILGAFRKHEDVLKISHNMDEEQGVYRIYVHRPDDAYALKMIGMEVNTDLRRSELGQKMEEMQRVEERLGYRTDTPEKGRG